MTIRIIRLINLFCLIIVMGLFLYAVIRYPVIINQYKTADANAHNQAVITRVFVKSFGINFLLGALSMIAIIYMNIQIIKIKRIENKNTDKNT